MPAYGRINLDAVLDSHARWLAGEPGGRCLDLRGADLSQMKLAGKNFSRGNLARANLEGADARRANFSGANLAGANLHTVMVDGADFTNAVLSRVFAAYVRFKDCNLAGCDLTHADLTMADMEEAIWGDDTESRLQRARLKIAADGDIIGWKKLRDGLIAKLLIPAAAQRSNSFSRRCRAEYVEVVSVITDDGRPALQGISRRDPDLVYRYGRRTTADSWDDSWWRDCAGGVHFFLTYEEAAAV